MPAITMAPGRPRRRWLPFVLIAAAFAAAPWPARAGPGKPAPLFAADDPLELTLAMPVRTLVAHKTQRPELDGTLSYADAAGATVSLDVGVTTRGHSRLELCSLPPLKLNFKRDETSATVFAGQDKLKLVTLCKNNARYEDYLQLEYLIYRLYAEVTPLSFRVRPVSMHYVDTEHKNRTESAPGFFIEDIGAVAERSGLKVVKRKELAAADLDARQLAVLSLFEYLIGSTDWSVLAADADDDCCHNAYVLGPRGADGGLIAVPFDFDQAGLINADYALPDQRLPIRNVRDRLYRGFCSGNGALEALIGRFDAARANIEALFREASLSNRSRSQALRYLTDSYQVLDDPERRQREIVERCRGH